MIGRLVVASSLLLAVGTACHAAPGLPVCGVRVVKSAAAEDVSKSLVRLVETWVNAPAKGTRLVSSIAEADVLLEILDYRPRTFSQGLLGEEWWFVARRLGDPSPRRASHRFIYGTPLDKEGQAHIARQLPIVIGDVCMGYLPPGQASDLKPNW